MPNEVESTQRCGLCKRFLPEDQFSASHRGRDGFWCKECAAARARGESVVAEHEPRQCVHCGEDYIPKQLKSAAKYCSRTCKDKAKNVKWRQDLHASKPDDRMCLHCGSQLPASARIDAKFCSRDCNNRAHALQRKLRARAGGDKPGFMRAEICARDQWMCQLCSDPVDPELRYPEPLCASLDHIVPVAHGGGNEAENLRLAHLVCNVRRGTRGG